MRPKTYPIQIWILDDDMIQSAQQLPDKQLSKTVLGCMQALVAARLYCNGIRSMRFYKYYFDKARKDETMDKFFPLWPFSNKPSFQQYGTQTSKWCRKCKEHFDFVQEYMRICLEEYLFRFAKEHAVSKFLEWNVVDAPSLKVPEAHLKRIVFPWKVLPPKFRSKDICAGYKKHLKSILDKDGGVQIGSYSKRDIPEFLLEESTLSEHML